jgi:hypothetical protein
MCCRCFKTRNQASITLTILSSLVLICGIVIAALAIRFVKTYEGNYTPFGDVYTSVAAKISDSGNVPITDSD